MKRLPGFTMIELLVGATIMLVAVLGALFIYARSNKVSVEQQMVTEIQNDVRSSMFFITRDLRMAGCGLPEEYSDVFIEGIDNEDQGAGAPLQPDRVRLMGNMDDPLDLSIQNYQGSSANVGLVEYSFEQYPYPDEFYENMVVLVLPNPESGCRATEIRVVTHVTHDAGGLNEKLNFSPGPAPDVNPPGGLTPPCGESDDYDGGMVCFINVKEYWLDTTGNIDGLTAGVNGYIGGGEAGVLYCTHNGLHFPIARNIENFQVEYNGDMNIDSDLDGWTPWNAAWSPEEIARIQQVRVWVLGRTPQAFTSVSGTPPGGIHLYRRPVLSNSPAALAEDGHRRFLLDSTSNVRNMSLNLYNIGQR
jgi:hypothetical protein